MDNFYVACDLGVESGRVMLGTLRKDQLTISEVRRFENQPIIEKGTIQWNIPHIYREILNGLRELSAYEEPLDSISCTSWPGDYLLFESNGTLMTPAFHYGDPRCDEGMEEVLEKISWESIYDETGVHKMPINTLFQLGAEKSRRLKKADRLLPVADGFNYILSGVARVDASLASATQLYNPISKTWSEQICKAMSLRPELLQPVVHGATRLGSLRADIARETKLEETQIVTSCSNELAAALFGIPVDRSESWAFLRAGTWTDLGTELVGPIISDESRAANFTNEAGFGGAVNFYKQVPGLWILDECKRHWKERDRELDGDVVKHLATSSAPFESLINLEDPRFLTAGDMPLKIQAYCRETNQPVPRKPGPVMRCVLESLALHYRKTFQEIESLTGRKFARLYVIGGSAHNLLYHFTANALQIPVTIAPPNVVGIGNVVAQALAQGHLKSIDQAREVIRNSFKTENIVPHADVWDEAYDRLNVLVPA